MNPPSDTELLCALYAEVSQHLELAESAAALFALLGNAVPLVGMAILRWEPATARLEPVAAAGEAAVHRAALPTPHADELLRWARTAAPRRWLSRGEARLPRLLCAEGAVGPIVALPLLHPELEGVLLLFGAGTEALARAPLLAAPFRAALENDRRVHELRRLREAAEGDRAALLSRLHRQDVSGAIVGATGGLADVMRRVAQVAPTDAPVLILGETGSGKEVVARALHEQSRRAAGPFLRVNCGAIPAELVDSELFGHEKGAFTGADGERKGLVEEAEGGTFFLDEIGDLHATAQTRLLRLLQEGEFRRVGSTRLRKADIRVVSATHRDLDKMVADGTFRQDLYHRLNVVRLHLPPLRERVGDILPLARHLIGRFRAEAGRAPLDLGASLEDRLLGHTWPGNVRELSNVSRYIAGLCPGPVAREEDLPAGFGPRVGAPVPGPSPRGSVDIAVPYAEAKRRWLEPFDEAYFTAVLRAHAGNVSAAARAADIDRKTIQRFLRRGDDE